MNTINKLICTLFVVTALVSCDVDKLTSFTDDFKITVDPDAVTNKKEIVIIDAVTGEPVTSPAITFSGDLASEIFSSAGFANITFDAGQVVIGLKPGNNPTEEAPATVEAEISATGYLTKSTTFEFDGTPVEATAIFLIPEAGLDNVQIESETKPQGEAIEVSASSADGGEDLAKVELPATTTFEDENGNAVSGDVTVEMETYELSADSGSDSGFNIFDEVPEIKSESGDIVVPSNVIKLNPTVGGETVIPSELQLTLDTTEDLFIILPDGTPFKITLPQGKNNNNFGIFNIDFAALHAQIQAALNIQLSFGDMFGFGLTFVQGTAIQGSSVCGSSEISYTNSGAAGAFTFTITEGTKKVISFTKTVYNGESKTIDGFTLSTDSSYDLEITVSTVDGVKTILNQSISCSTLGSTIELENNSQYPSVTKNIDQKVECDGVAVALNQTTINYRKFDGADKTYYVYGKIINGTLTGKFPVLEASTGYQFSLNYDGLKANNQPISGSQIDAGVIEQDDIDKICAEVE